jgi:prolipoprotein diacylglyceryltransferase
MYWNKKGDVYQGLLISIFLILVFTSRFLIEFVKEPQVEFEAMMKLNMGQLLSIPFIILGVLGLWLSLKIKKPGLVKARK